MGRRYACWRAHRSRRRRLCVAIRQSAPRAGQQPARKSLAPSGRTSPSAAAALATLQAISPETSRHVPLGWRAMIFSGCGNSPLRIPLTTASRSAALGSVSKNAFPRAPKSHSTKCRSPLASGTRELMTKLRTSGVANQRIVRLHAEVEPSVHPTTAALVGGYSRAISITARQLPGRWVRSAKLCTTGPCGGHASSAAGSVATNG
jgi:hypothetical protein